MAELVDGGKRKEFDSGAVREITDEKGRCDLLPLDVCASLLDRYYFEDSFDGVSNCASAKTILCNIYAFIHNSTPYACILYDCLREFSKQAYCDDYLEMLLDVSKQYADGAKKYADRNWEKGLPVHCYLDSAVRHYLKFLRGDEDEPHGRAFVWNILGAIWTLDNRPEFNDIHKYVE